MKDKLSIDQQIQHMKENEITFSLFKEDEAKEFLKCSNYFFKVKSFAKNYQKIDDKYIDLDFIYLKELALMDTLLRNIVLELSLIIEHILKVNFINDITNNLLEDGYTIINSFINNKREPTIFTNYNQRRESVDFYTRGLMDKYYNSGFPAWAFVEILTFSELLTLLKFYYTENNNTHTKFYNNSLLYNVKKLRNVSAHNNCFLNNLIKTEGFVRTRRLLTEVKNLNMQQYSNRKIDTLCEAPAIHDYASVLIVFNKLCPSEMKNILIKNKIKYSLDRFSKHIDYFTNNKDLNEKLQFILELNKKIFNI